MIVTREQYDAVGKGQPLLIFRTSKIRKRGSATAFKNGREVETFGPLKITEGNGTILEPKESIGLRESKCPYPIDRTATLRYREYPKGWKRGRDPLPPAQGKGIPIIVTEAERQEDGRWLIRWERIGPHRPAPISGSNYFLAPAQGYTSSADQSIDREAPAIASEEIEAMVADDLAARREQQRQHLERVRAAVSPMYDDEELERFAHRFEQLLHKAEQDVA